MKKIKAVIFDLDGTLADTLPLCIRAFRQSIEPLIKKSLTDEQIIATFGPSEEGTIMALAPDHYDKGVADYLRLYADLHDMCPTAFDGIAGLLQDLKQRGVRIAMVTGKGQHSTQISLQKFGLLDYFEVIETGVAAGPRKAEGIQAVLDFLEDCTNEEVIYVGDAPSDIIASRKANVAVVAACWAATTDPEKLEELHPDELFHTVPDFSDWLHTRL